MTVDPNTHEAIAWLGQFEGNDEAVARRLLENIRYVTADEFRRELSDLVISRADGTGEPIALYAERKVRSWRGVANRLFKETNGKIKRAHGSGPPPVRSRHAGRHETGSEGIVANLITQVVRPRRNTFLDHPGPDTIRQRRVRRFILVTDFIGSGSQSSHYLDAAWRLASVKSWKSGKFMRFEVVCFSACQEGLEKLRNHPAKPNVTQVTACPTLSTFHPYGGKALSSLCERYGPRDYETKIPHLGYGNVGALIAFAHGMPNNAPRLLFTKGRNWAPLFPARVTTAFEPANMKDKKAKIARRLERLRESRIANIATNTGLNFDTDLSVLVLAALKRRPRNPEIVSARTGLGLAETIHVLERIRGAGWIDASNRLTGKAYQELNYLREQSGRSVNRYQSNKSAYFPQSLRAPKEGFS